MAIDIALMFGTVKCILILNGKRYLFSYEQFFYN